MEVRDFALREKDTLLSGRAREEDKLALLERVLDHDGTEPEWREPFQAVKQRMRETVFVYDE